MGMVGLRDVFVVAPASSFHPHHHHHDGLLPATEHPIIPLLTATPCLVEDSIHHDGSRGRTPAGIHLWQNQQNQSLQNPNPSSSSPYLRKPMPMLDSASTQSAAAGLLHSCMGAGGGVMGGIGPGSSTATCQDCGNQAKKDCSHRRCRTCCKSRGYDCSTHVKSTWVPAARRRERQNSSAAALAAGSSASTSSAKKPRLITSHATTTTTTASHTSTSNTTPPRSFDTSSSHQGASFRENLPRQVRAPATFKCVRVTSIDDGEDQYAYQAMVKIGGHVFKGFLYDQGMDESRDHNNENSSNTNNNNTGGNDNSCIPNISELHLGGGGPSDVYAAPGSGGGGLMGGTAFGNPMN